MFLGKEFVMFKGGYWILRYKSMESNYVVWHFGVTLLNLTFSLGFLAAEIKIALHVAEHEYHLHGETNLLPEIYFIDLG